MKRILLGLLVLLFGVSAMASDIVWIRLEPQMSYKDLNYSCDNMSLFNAVFVAAEVMNGKFIQAKLRTSQTTATEKNSISLDANELTGAEVVTDIQGKFWLKKITLSAKSLNWVFNAFKGTFDACTPPKALKTLDPNTAVFSFTLPSEEVQKQDGIFQLAAPLQIFKGELVTGASYRVELVLTQKQMAL